MIRRVWTSMDAPASPSPAWSASSPSDGLQGDGGSLQLDPGGRLVGQGVQTPELTGGRVDRRQLEGQLLLGIAAQTDRLFDGESSRDR